jgi:beta-glucanase (GH16 family)
MRIAIINLFTVAYCAFILSCSQSNTSSQIEIEATSKTTFQNLVWSDEFDGESLNMENWSIREVEPGWVNAELQRYVKDSTIKVSSGLLFIQARKSQDGYVSGRIYSQGKREFTYGRMEIRAKLPTGKGTWPALWMLGTNIDSVGWPKCGEIDLMEHIGTMQNIVHGTVHNAFASGDHHNTGGLKVNTASTEFHNYAMEWDKDKIKFFIDDLNYYTYQPEVKDANNWPYDQKFYFIINFAIGGYWPGFDIDDTKLPQTLEVDYVRVYQ